MTANLFYHYLLSKRAGALVKIISRLCIIGIGVGVFALVVVLNIMNGFNDSISGKLLAIEPHLVVYTDDFQNPKLLSFLKSSPVESYFQFEQQDVILRTLAGNFGGAEAKGISEESLREIMGRVFEQNKKRDSSLETFFSTENFTLGEKEVVLGADLAGNLGIYEGEQIIVVPPESLLLPSGEAPAYEKVTVVALIYSEIAEIDSKLMFYARGKTMGRLESSASITDGYEIRLKDINSYHLNQKKLEALGFKVESWVDRNASLFFALKMEKLVMSIFLSLGALITCFSIVSVLILLMTQKKSEIGILMALGLSPARTKRIFTGVGLMLSGLGMGGGLVLGIILSLILDNYALNILPDIYYDTQIPARVNWVVMGFITLGVSIISLLAAWIPVHANVDNTPAQAISSGKNQ